MIKTKLIFAAAFALLTIARIMDAETIEPPPIPSPPVVNHHTPSPQPVPPVLLTPAQPVIATPTPTPAPAGFKPGISDVLFGNLVRLRARTSHSFIPTNNHEPMYLQLDLDAKNKGQGTRSKLAIAIVIDRSGSMDGVKMQQTRKATQALIDRLANDDQVAIVSYADNVQINLHLSQVEDVGRDSVSQIVNELYPAGGTNLSSGLKAAIRILKDGRNSNTVKRVIIMSDGNANQGITSPHRLSQIVRNARHAGVSVTSMGVGLDFNEDLMTQLAENGGGRYHFVEDANSIQAALATEFRGLSQVVAQQLEVQLNLPKHVELVKVFGFPITKKNKRTITIPVGDISKGEHRQILAELRVSSSKQGYLPVSRIRMSYMQAKPKKKVNLAKNLTVAVSNNSKNLSKAENLTVIETVSTILAAQTRIEVAKDYARGDVDGALRKTKSQMKRTKKMAKRLKSGFLGQIYNELKANAEDM